MSIVMRALEDALVEIENALGSTNTTERVMSEFQDEVPESLKPAISQKVAELRDEVREAKEYYDLQVETVSGRRRLSSQLLMLTIDLTETTSHYLRGYGEVPEAEKSALDQRIMRIERAVNELQRLISSETTGL
jgi:hypothetical protein